MDDVVPVTIVPAISTCGVVTTNDPVATSDQKLTPSDHTMAAAVSHTALWAVHEAPFRTLQEFLIANRPGRSSTAKESSRVNTRSARHDIAGRGQFGAQRRKNLRALTTWKNRNRNLIAP